MKLTAPKWENHLLQLNRHHRHESTLHGLIEYNGANLSPEMKT
jgi:hypothetical protein